MMTVLVLSLLLVDEASSVWPEGYCNLNPGYCNNGGKQSQPSRVSWLLLASGQ